MTGHHNETSGARLVDFLLENIFTNHDEYVVNKINWSNLMIPVSENLFFARIRIVLSITKQYNLFLLWPFLFMKQRYF